MGLAGTRCDTDRLVVTRQRVLRSLQVFEDEPAHVEGVEIGSPKGEQFLVGGKRLFVAAKIEQGRWRG